MKGKNVLIIELGNVKYIDEIKKSFKEGEEMELITFITTDKLKLAENRKLEQIKEDFDD